MALAPAAAVADHVVMSRLRPLLNLLLVLALAVQALGGIAHAHCRHAPGAELSATAALDAHAHRHAAMNDSAPSAQDPTPAPDGCGCGCDCIGACPPMPTAADARGEVSIASTAAPAHPADTRAPARDGHHLRPYRPPSTHPA